VLVTAGATEAIAAAMLALLEPGDEVCVRALLSSYTACIAMAGGVRVPVRCARRTSAPTWTRCAPP